MTLLRFARLGTRLLGVGLTILIAVENASAQAPVINASEIGAISVVDELLSPEAAIPPLPAAVVRIADDVDDQSAVRLAQATALPPSPAAAQPSAGGIPSAAAPAQAGGAGTSSASMLGLSANLQAVLGGSAAESFLFLNKDAGALLGRSVPGISTAPRAPLVNDPILRGRRLGQSGAKGSFWAPARQDLDTALSKIDPRLMQNINVFKGPYSALYGPSFSFYDIELFDAPRYECLCPGVFQHSGMTVLEYETNGEQWHGRQAFWGGTTDWGYRVGYSHRTGNDYETGAGTKLPSSYNSRELDIALGANLTTNSKIDFSYLRLDQTNMEFPGQYFDIRGLVTDAYGTTFVVEDQARFDRLEVEGWYNQTRFNGDNLAPGKRSILPLDGFITIDGTTDVEAFSTGYRMAMEWGDPTTGLLTAGTDLRYLGQQLSEVNRLTSFLGVIVGSEQIPKSHSSNPGVFVELETPVSDRLWMRSGGRLDWVSMNADSMSRGEDVAQDLGGNLDQHFNLGSAFLTSQYQLSDHQTIDAGVGYAMRAPTMTELYAAGPKLTVLPQNVFTGLFGNPLLDPERMWQIDLGINSEYGRWRNGLSGFYSWVEDYVTFDLLDNANYSYVNTPLATLAGFEMYGEYDLSCRLTAFGTASLTEGRDHSRLETISRQRQLQAPDTPRSQRLIFDPLSNGFIPDPQQPGSTAEEEPLPVIAPLESRVGLRLHSPEPCQTWSLEFAANITDVQDRVASSLIELVSPGYTTFDLTGHWQARQNMLMTAGVVNMTDKFYRSNFDTRRVGSVPVNSVFRPGISFYFGAELTY